MKEYDDKEHLVYSKDSMGIERWYAYNENTGDNNKIHYKDSNGFEWWCNYDLNNNEIYFKDYNGYETWTEYDKNNNRIHYRNSIGYETWFDNKGIKITEKEYILSILTKWKRESNERV